MILSHCSSVVWTKCLQHPGTHPQSRADRQTDIKSSRINRPARAPEDAITNKRQKYMNASPPRGFIMSRGTTQGVIFTRVNTALPSSDGSWIHNNGVTWNRPPSFPSAHPTRIHVYEAPTETHTLQHESRHYASSNVNITSLT